MKFLFSSLTLLAILVATVQADPQEEENWKKCKEFAEEHAPSTESKKKPIVNECHHEKITGKALETDIYTFSYTLSMPFDKIYDCKNVWVMSDKMGLQWSTDTETTETTDPSLPKEVCQTIKRADYILVNQLKK